MENMKAYEAHILVLPYSGQGHINPMLQFSKRLASKGLKITMATMLSTTRSMKTGTESITLESIYDDVAGVGLRSAGGYKAFIEKFEDLGSLSLTELIQNLENSDYPVKCLVYDANLPWALTIAKRFGIYSAAFFTQSCTAIASYYPMHLDYSGEESPVPVFSLPGLPELGLPNLPSLGSSDTGRYPPIIRHILRQFNGMDQVDWVLFNSFDKLEEEVVKWMVGLWPVRTIGPTVPSIYLDKRVENDRDYGFNLYKADNEKCMEWLSTKKAGSVLYISFGSAAGLSSEQMKEMAYALRKTNKSFLWVVKANEELNLPNGFVEETADKGLVVTWCPQLEVLTHSAVGCFVTHCGWNSTVEALSFGVPMVGIPQFLDQMTNAYLVEKVWRVGAQPKVNQSGIASGEEIERCIREVMEGERGEEINKNAKEWKELGKEAVDEGGSSDKYMNEIIARLMND